LRNEGAKRAKGAILVFIDDDIVATKNWLKEILSCFTYGNRIGGVSGPSIIDSGYRKNRDLFRYPMLKKLYDWLFLDGLEQLPGHITSSGAWTTGACNESCSYEGRVDFLEACNMAFKREAFEKVGGFDESYRGIGDWSEPDLAYRIRKEGSQLWFNPRAKLYHCPSRSGAFKLRLTDSKNRFENYLKFSNRHVPYHWRNELYKIFLRCFYAVKSA